MENMIEKFEEVAPEIQPLPEFDNRLTLYKAVADSNSIDADLNESENGSLTFDVANIVIYNCEIPDMATGELVMKTRSIFVEPNGVAHSTMSDAVANAVRQLVGIVGEPATWPSPVPLKFYRVTGKNHFKYITFDLAE